LFDLQINDVSLLVG